MKSVTHKKNNFLIHKTDFALLIFNKFLNPTDKQMIQYFNRLIQA